MKIPHCKFFFNDVASGKELCSILETSTVCWLGMRLELPMINLRTLLLSAGAGLIALLAVGCSTVKSGTLSPE